MLFKINLKTSVEWSFILLVDPRGGHTLTLKIDRGLSVMARSSVLLTKVGSYTNWLKKLSDSVFINSKLAGLPLPIHFPPVSDHLMSEWLKSPKTMRLVNSWSSTRRFAHIRDSMILPFKEVYSNINYSNIRSIESNGLFYSNKNSMYEKIESIKKSEIR